MNDQERLAAALADRYRIERELGQGGMATVYLAEDLKHRRRVAIKVLLPDLASAIGPERFLREIETTANLRHPHILPLYDSGDAAGFLFYVMPFVEGESLRDRLDREKQLPIDEALQIAREVADALGYAHGRGIVHRDIKPENILLEGGHAVVADFGIARAVSAAGGDRLTQTGMAVGTPLYMSPEQAAGERDLDGRSDLYSLGCVLYEMLGGQAPFTGPTVESVVRQHVMTEAAPITNLRPTVPAEVAGALARALAKTPADRFNPVVQFADALRPGSVVRTTIAARSSVAVLPFSNLSADPQDEFFADGITEEIINALGQVAGLKVAARTSCFAFKGKTEDLRVVAERLGVATVLEGSVRKAGSRIRVTAQLIGAADGFHLWSERYDSEMADVFALQDEIAGAIAAKLQVALSPPPSRPAGPRNVEAYELLLKGRVLATRRGRWVKDALACFERAVELDPELTEAHALLADCYRLLAVYHIAPANEMMPRARAAAERALARDPGQVEALATLASVVSLFDWDITGGAAITDRALARDPSHVRALCERGVTWAVLDDAPDLWERGLLDIRRARAADPLNAWAAAVHAMGLQFLGRLDDSVVEARAAVALDAENFTARWALVNVLVDLGRIDEALREAEPALAMSGRHQHILGAVAAAHAARGDRDAAEAVFQELSGRARTAFVGWSEQGTAAAAAGRLEEARALVARGVEARESYLTFWKFPAWGPLRADPEGSRILRSTGISTRRVPA